MRRALLLCLVPGLLAAAELRDFKAVPQLGPLGIEGYQAFLASGQHRAFVIAPGGTWIWHADLPSRELAERAALQECRETTDQTCVTYALDDQLVFDAKAWPKLWGPYASVAAAQGAPVGVKRGERFPDLVYRDAAGQAGKVSDLRGQVVFLHFWGSWCGPCRRELPDLQQLVSKMAPERDIRFVFLPVREPFSVARDWARTQKLSLPLFSSWVEGKGEHAFTLADGTKLPDRQVAGKFPTTYVLDKHGIVIFAHAGDASRWTEYVPFLKDALLRSGK